MQRDTQVFRNFTVTYPRDHIILVTIERPSKLNCIDLATSREIAKVWEQLDNDEDFRVGIITGSGRAFCTGADLQEWNQMHASGVVNDMSAPGLAGLPRRQGKKPIIAAVNGITMGGGFEMVANCDIVVASASATFALPEVKRGIVPVAGCLPRLAHTLGVHRTMDLVLTGRTVQAQQLAEWGLISHVVPPENDVLDAAISVAAVICQNSPDAVIIGRKGVRMAWNGESAEDSVEALSRDDYMRLVDGANFAEGIRAFVEKRDAQWTPSRL